MLLRLSKMDINVIKYKAISEEPDESDDSYFNIEVLDNQDINIQ
ncbi:8040_t:CDS:1, partial [Racocetra fulgida]